MVKLEIKLFASYNCYRKEKRWQKRNDKSSYVVNCKARAACRQLK